MLRAVDDEPMHPKRSALMSVPAKALVAIGLLVITPLIFKALGAQDATETTFESGSFGTVTVYAPDDEAGGVVLFMSGEEGWNGVVVDMANQLRSWGALVAGIDGRAYLAALHRRDACANPAADFEQLGRDLQQHAGVTPVRVPTLIGYGTGATLVYAAAAQAQSGEFAAVTSLGFCAELPVETSLCEGAGLQTATTPGRIGIALQPRADLPMPWILLHGSDDAACPIGNALAFAGAISSAKVVTMPKVTHAFAVHDDWLEQFRDAYLKLATATTEAQELPEDVGDLPLVEVPATAGDSRRMALLLTGDGGWAGLDRGVSDQLAASGIPVVALSTLRYFWTEQKPADVARDLERIMAHYLTAWHKDQVVLIGYSFGANVLPFIVAELSPTYRDRIASLNLLGLATHTSFEIHVADWIPGSEPEGAPIAPEFDKLTDIRTLCIYGADETDSLCPLLPPSAVQAVEMPGDHHFDDDARSLVKHMIEFVGT
jgi:type IV secretory pathway VirJ component